jgi:hypothetical protein
LIAAFDPCETRDDRGAQEEPPGKAVLREQRFDAPQPQRSGTRPGYKALQVTDWFKNDRLFFSQLATGHAFAEYAASELRRRGITVAVTPMEVRDDVADRHRFADEYDLLVGGGQSAIVDVKSRDLDFTSPTDYPYATRSSIRSPAGRQRSTNRLPCC